LYSIMISLSVHFGSVLFDDRSELIENFGSVGYAGRGGSGWMLNE
jgi:hypothetical protein